MLDSGKIIKYSNIVAEGIVRFRLYSITLLVALTAFALAGLSHLQMDTSQESLFLEGDGVLQAKREFEAIFGSEDMGLALATANNIFTAENLRLLRELGQELEARVPYADDVLSITEFDFTLGTPDGLEIINLIPENLDALPTDAASLQRIKELALTKPFLKNRLISDDGREAWVMLRLKPLPTEPDSAGELPADVMARAFIEVAQQDKYQPLHLKVAGHYVSDLEKKEFFGKETPRLLGISIASMALLLGLALRCWQGIVFPMVTVIASIVIVLGIQGHMRISMDPTTLFLPIFLSLTLATCYSIHIFNFYLTEFRRTGKRRHSILFGLAKTGWPQLFSSLTTMVALLSFLAIPLRPIRWVGLTSACLVIVSWFLITLVVPALLSFGKDKAPLPAEKLARGSFLDRIVDYCGAHCLNRPWLSLGLFTSFLLVCAAAALNLEVSFDIRRTFGKGVPYVKRLIEVSESKVGTLNSYGVAIEFPEPDMAKDPVALARLDALGEEVRNYPLTKRVSSLTDIIKDLNQVINDGSPEAFRIPDTREEVAQLLLLYENAGGSESGKWLDYDYQRLRLQVEISDYNSGVIMKQIEDVRRRCAELFPKARVVFTGSISQFTVLMDYITWGQINSNSLSLLTIAALMALAFGSIRTGVISMIPNIIPGFVVVAAMGLFTIPLDIMTVTIVPMLLGLAVDDTIHFISHCRIDFEATGSYTVAVHSTFRTVGKAIFITSGILVLGFGSYLFSDINVFIHMGWLIGAGVLAALVAECFITPVLLYKLKTFGPEWTAQRTTGQAVNKS
jgi:predicted RND superfamily exporter protein